MVESPIHAGRLDERALRAYGGRLASVLEPPLVIFLEGDLGAGKTTLARALIHGLGYPDRVKSPTYGLLEKYDVAGMHVLHLDLYRISEAGELEFLGLVDLLDSRTILVVEWPDRADAYLPPPDITLSLEYADEERLLDLCPHTQWGVSMCRKLTEISSN